MATKLHTSPVLGMCADVAGTARAIRSMAPDRFIVVDTVQHAAHGRLDIASHGISV